MISKKNVILTATVFVFFSQFVCYITSDYIVARVSHFVRKPKNLRSCSEIQRKNRFALVIRYFFVKLEIIFEGFTKKK